jgi:Putative DnaT-like ssDNA binding protein
MTIAIVGTNSYVTEAEATTYFADRFGFDKWVAETKKNEALISATQIQDLLCIWNSEKSDPDQTLEFPRVAYDPTPQDIKDAQCEIAYAIIDNASVSTEGERLLKSLDAKGKLEWLESKNYNNPLVNDLVVNLLSQYGLCSGGGSTTIIPIDRA